jgi:hypothetical protein
MSTATATATTTTLATRRRHAGTPSAPPLWRRESPPLSHVTALAAIAGAAGVPLAVEARPSPSPGSRN